MAQHRQTQQDAQHTETKLFSMFLSDRIKHSKHIKQKESFRGFTGFGYINN